MPDHGESAPTAPTVWIITRREPDGSGEQLAALTDEVEAHTIVDALGEGHEVEVGLPLLSPGGGHRVVVWWRCRAVVRGGEVEVGEPAQMAGAARLLLPGEQLELTERVRDDVEAGELEQVVHGVPVRHVDAFAQTAERARELAALRGRFWAGEAGSPD
jgi:hypothetical protein